MPDPKKLVFVCNTSWGIYKFRLTLIRQLIKAGYPVFVLAPEDRYSEYLDHEQGLTFIRLHHFKPTSFSLLHDWQLYRELRRHYLHIQPQLIFHYTIKANIYGTLAARAAGCLSISVITGLGYTFLNNMILRQAVSFMYRFSLKRAAETWFLNEDDRLYFTQHGIVPAGKTAILPGEGIDTGKFIAKGHYAIRPTLVFLLIGRIIKEKGIAEYAAAAAILKQKGYAVECQLVGFYDYKNPSSVPHKKFMDWVSQGLITYHGGTDEIMPFIENADCLVLPSYREGIPFSLLEGGSMRRPLIAADTAGCHDIVVPGRNGFLCREKDAKSLAAAMEAFYGLSPAERLAMGEEARKIVCEKFTREIVEAKYFSTISRYTQAPDPVYRLSQMTNKF
ncbi:MAG: glycosyltransferase family 4 protein [Flavitalea sp.]